MKELLKKHLKSNEYVSVYASPRDSKEFLFGKILAVDEDFFAFLGFDVVGIVESTGGGICKVALIDKYGFSDGYAEFRAGDITMVTFMSKSDRIREKLFEKSKKA